VSAPTVSVVLPTRNRSSLVRDALNTVFNQRDCEFEVIVVDEASTDDTPRVLAEFDDPRLQVIRNEPARGVALARNTAAEVAQGEWIAFLDDDDLWAPDRLRRQLDVADADGGEIAYCSNILIDSDRIPSGVALAQDPVVVHRNLYLVNALGGPSSVMVRRERFDEVGGFDPAFSALADWDLWLRVGDRTDRFSAVGDALVAYTEYEHNMVVRDPSGVQREYNALFARHAPRARERGWDVDRHEFSRWIAGELVRHGYPRAAAQFHFSVAVTRLHPMFALRALRAMTRRSPLWLKISDARVSPDWLTAYQAVELSPEPRRKRKVPRRRLGRQG